LLNDCFECHVSALRADKAVNFLETASGLSKQSIKAIMQKGAVWVTRNNHTRRLRREGKVLNYKDEIHLYYNKAVLGASPKPAHLIVDKHAYSIWLKPRGMLCQGSKWGDHCTISRWVEQNLIPKRPAFVVHRLDRATCGLIIIAHTKNTTSALANLFEQRAVEKKYKALVEGHFLPADQPVHVETDIDGRAASSEVTLLKYDASLNQSLLDVKINTGRKHQIRRHLSGIGFPIIGDRLYGKADGSTDNDQIDLQLTAYYLSFQCPVSREIMKYEV